MFDPTNAAGEGGDEENEFSWPSAGGQGEQPQEPNFWQKLGAAYANGGGGGGGGAAFQAPGGGPGGGGGGVTPGQPTPSPTPAAWRPMTKMSYAGMGGGGGGGSF